MLGKLTRKLQELNRLRLYKRRQKRMRTGDDSRYYPPLHVHRVAKGKTVDIIEAYGDRSPLNAAEIRLPNFDSPEVSIVISAYGKVEYTLRCLRSIMMSPPSRSYEVIVIEDASGDPAAQVLKQVQGLRYIENDCNLGYLRSNNKAVALSHGTYVHLLNNDTQVLPAAIDALIELCALHPKSMVGSKLIYPDGTLQEAGGIIWSDGSGWNYGRGDHPSRRQYNYVRPADYCSGASILLRRSTWDELGGYDEHFLPAYCEDSDLAFRVRAGGGQVFYQPGSVVIHDEGVSHGKSTDSGIKKHQIENTQKLLKRWSQVMAEDQFPCDQGYLLKARDRAKSKKTILIIDHGVPTPDQDAGSKTMLAFMSALQELGHVVKLWSDSPTIPQEYVTPLSERGIEVIGMPEIFTFSRWMTEHGKCIDAFILSRPGIADRYIDTIREFSKAKIIFYGHDMHHQRIEAEAKLLADGRLSKSAQKMQKTELSIWNRCDVSLYPSMEEVETARRLAPLADIRAISPYSLTPAAIEDGPDASVSAKDLVFVAGFKHKPNEDAAKWLVDQVLPIILKVHPDAHLFLVGSNPTQAVQSLAGPSVTVTGSVTETELVAHYRRARVALAPLRFGAGVKLKVLEAMAEGTPIVTTSVGAQGLQDAAFLKPADDPQAFAEQVIELIENSNLRRARIKMQSELVQQHYSGSAIRELFSQIT